MSADDRIRDWFAPVVRRAVMLALDPTFEPNADADERFSGILTLSVDEFLGGGLGDMVQELRVLVDLAIKEQLDIDRQG